MLNMKYCRTENVIAALREWEDDNGTDEHLHNDLYELCLRIAAEAGHTVDLSQCSQVTRHLILELIQRDAHGRAKYGTTLDREDLSPEQWLQHMKEELLDGAGYAEACIRKLHKSKENN